MVVVGTNTVLQTLFHLYDDYSVQWVVVVVEGKRNAEFFVSSILASAIFEERSEF